MKALLVSNSTNFGEGYLDHCIDEMLDVLGSVRRLAFVPFAIQDQVAYGEAAARRFAQVGVEANLAAPDQSGVDLLSEAPAVFVGGGNTFRLLKTLQELGMVRILAERARAGMIYMGASAGSNIAAPTIRTTNDMPIVEPSSFDALGLVTFQINPHYIDADPGSQHMGETRQQRLEEFLEENDTPVVGLREGAWLRLEGADCVLGGKNGARILRRDHEPEERASGESVADLLGSPPN